MSRDEPTTPNASPHRRALIVEDDPITAAYLVDALALLGVDAAAVARVDAALARLAVTRYDLVLVDQQLADGDGLSLRRQALTGAPAAADGARWIALGAGLDDAARAHLAAEGFIDAWSKPIALDQLAAALGMPLAARVLREPTPPVAHPALLDERAAIERLGNPGLVARMRTLLAEELATALATFRTLAETDTPRLAGEVHRLSGSTALCGAERVRAALGAVDAARGDPSALHRAIDALEQALRATITAIRNDEA